MEVCWGRVNGEREDDDESKQMWRFEGTESTARRELHLETARVNESLMVGDE